MSRAGSLGTWALRAPAHGGASTGPAATPKAEEVPPRLGWGGEEFCLAGGEDGILSPSASDLTQWSATTLTLIQAPSCLHDSTLSLWGIRVTASPPARASAGKGLNKMTAPSLPAACGMEGEN